MSGCSARPARRRRSCTASSRSTRSRSSRTSARRAKPGRSNSVELDEGAFYLGLMAAAHRVPFYPTRAGLGTDMLTTNPQIKLVKSPYDDGEELVAIPAFEARRGAAAHEPRRRSRQLPVPRARPLLRRPHGDGGRQGLRVGRADHPHRRLPEARLGAHAAHPAHVRRPAWSKPRWARTSRECPPDYERDEAFQREYAATAKDDDAWQAFKAKYLDLPTHDDYVKAIQARGGKRMSTDVTLDEICCHRHRRGVPRRRRDPVQPDRRGAGHAVAASRVNRSSPIS